MLYLIIIGVYFLGMIIVGVFSRRAASGADDFLVAGRKGSSLFITGSLLATIIGGSATVGMAGLGFTRGLTGMWWLLVGSIGLLVLGFFLAKKVRKFALYTLPGLVEKQYDKRVALATSVLIVVSWVGILAAQIIAVGKILSVVGIGDPLLWMAIFTMVFIVYLLFGGQYAIIRTDSVQAVIVFIGIFGALALVLSNVGGWGGLQSSLPPDHFAFPVSAQFDGVDLISLLLVVGLTYVVGPDIYTRIFSARGGGTARKSAIWVALLIIPLAIAITIIGMGAAFLFPQISAEHAFPTVIKEVLPPFLGGIVLAALLCAIMSSADTILLSASAILVVDIIGKIKPELKQEKIVPLTRWAIIVFGLCALALALVLKGVISSLLFAYTIYTAGIILPVIFGFYKARLHITATGALAALIGGGALGLVSKLTQIQYLDLGALALGVFLLFAVSFIDNRIKGRRLDDSEAIQ